MKRTAILVLLLLLLAMVFGCPKQKVSVLVPLMKAQLASRALIVPTAVDVSPVELVFPDQVSGEIGVELPFVVSNGGTAPVTIAQFGVSADWPFGVEIPTLTIPPGQSITCTGYFTPAVPGSYLREIRVDTNAGLIVVPVSGNGI